MQHQCFQLASILSSAEWKRFLQYAKQNSPSYGPDLWPVVNAVAHLHPAFALPDEEVWHAAFPQKAFDDARLRVLRSYFKKILEQFLIHLELEIDPLRSRLMLSKALLKRGALVAAERQLAVVNKELPTPSMQVSNFELQLELEELSLDLAMQQKRVGPDYPWENLLDKVTTFATLKRLHLLASKLGTKGFFANHSRRIAWHLEDTLEDVEQELLEREPLARVFHQLLLLLLGQAGSESSSIVFDILAAQASDMDREERWNILGILVNHYFEQQRQRVPGSLEMVFRVFREMHRQDLIFDLGASTEVAIRNIVQVGIRLGETAWVRAFLDEVHARLPQADRERIYRYGSAQLAFGEGQFADARRHLARFEITTSAERLYHDNLYMRICYELDDRDGLEVISSALFRHLYRKEQIAESTKKGAINLARAILALHDLRWSPSPKTDLAGVTAYIDQLQPISHLDWIQAKLAELAIQPAP